MTVLETPRGAERPNEPCPLWAAYADALADYERAPTRTRLDAAETAFRDFTASYFPHADAAAIETKVVVWRQKTAARISIARRAA